LVAEEEVELLHLSSLVVVVEQLERSLKLTAVAEEVVAVEEPQLMKIQNDLVQYFY
jgi:hypothetical protein